MCRDLALFSQGLPLSGPAGSWPCSASREALSTQDPGLGRGVLVQVSSSFSGPCCPFKCEPQRSCPEGPRVPKDLGAESLLRAWVGLVSAPWPRLALSTVDARPLDV